MFIFLLKKAPQKIILCLFISCMIIYLSGCACLMKKNRRLLNRMDKAVEMDSVSAKIALAPLAIPAGTAIFITDASVVHPVYSIAPAADDIYRLYWKPREMSSMRKALIFVPIVVLTPPTFVGDWVGRILFPIQDNMNKRVDAK